MEENLVFILLGLYALSEGLSLIPKVKSNGTFQLVFNTLKSIKPFLEQLAKKKKSGNQDKK